MKVYVTFGTAARVLTEAFGEERAYWIGLLMIEDPTWMADCGFCTLQRLSPFTWVVTF